MTLPPLRPGFDVSAEPQQTAAASLHDDRLRKVVITGAVITTDSSHPYDERPFATVLRINVEERFEGLRRSAAMAPLSRDGVTELLGITVRRSSRSGAGFAGCSVSCRSHSPTVRKALNELARTVQRARGLVPRRAAHRSAVMWSRLLSARPAGTATVADPRSVVSTRSARRRLCHFAAPAGATGPPGGGHVNDGLS
jgi:hypothetical protein